MLGIKKMKRSILTQVNLFRFNIRKWIFGFEVSNLFIQRVDKYSILFILKNNGARIGKNCDIESGQIFHNCKDYSNLIIGDNCHIGKNCFFDLRDKVIIKNGVVISMQCTFITHIDLAKSNLSVNFPPKSGPIKIYDNCYIGVKSTILHGVEIKEGVFVGANSTVIRNTNANELIGGTPAMFIKKI
jgi:maltose O-acetyltransferase